MSKKRYRVKCDCGNDMWEVLGATIHPMGDLDIYLMDVPFFWCEDCESVVYRKALAINDILYKAYKNDCNVVFFDFEDLPSICSYLLE